MSALCLAGRQVDRRGRLWATQQPVEDAAPPVAGRLRFPQSHPTLHPEIPPLRPDGRKRFRTLRVFPFNFKCGMLSGNEN